MNSYLNCIDLFAGAGGLSEGCVREGYNSVRYVEMEEESYETLKTRIALHYLKEKRQLHLYQSYLKNEISRECLYSYIPYELLESVINQEISTKTIERIFERIDESLDSKKV